MAIDNYKLVQAMIEYDAETGTLYFKERLNKQDLIDAGFDESDATIIVSDKTRSGQEVEPALTSEKANQYAVRFTVRGHKVRLLAAQVVWALATGTPPEDPVIFRDGDPTNLLPNNLIKCTSQAARLLQGYSDGIKERGTGVSTMYCAEVRYKDGSSTRQLSGTWSNSLSAARQDRKRLLQSAGLWNVSVLSEVLKETA